MSAENSYSNADGMWAMALCVICKEKPGTLKIKDGNPAYKGKPVCKDCQRYRRLLMDTR